MSTKKKPQVVSGEKLMIRFMPDWSNALPVETAAAIEDVARASGDAFVDIFMRSSPGELGITLDEAKTYADRTARDHAFASANKRNTLERIINTLLDYAKDRCENAANVEDYARRRVADLSVGTSGSEVVSVQIAEELDRLDCQVHDAFKAAAFANAVLIAAEEAGLTRFERRDYSYASRKASMPRDAAKPVTPMTDRQRAQLARLTR
jgi:hypothetical protein